MKRIKQLCQQLISGERPDLVFWSLPFVVLIVFLFPFLLTRNGFGIFDYTKTGQIGDTIGGITAPIVALIAAILTFLAFWIQLRANIAHTGQFNKQDIDTKIDRFENKFYELLKLHRDNVSEINIANKVHSRKAFLSMFKEFKFAYYSLICVYNSRQQSSEKTQSLNEHDFVNISYIIFFMGVGETSDKLSQGLIQKYEKSLIDEYIDYLKNCQKMYKDNGVVAIRIDDGTVAGTVITFEKYKPFSGHMSRLGHYYRHLFQTVKFVVEYDNEIIKDKHEYLKTLRAQLSTHEQLLLYYNGLSPLGRPWIDNQYFTEHRMIKNLPLPLADFGPNPKDQLGERDSRGKLLFEWDEIMSRNYHT